MITRKPAGVLTNLEKHTYYFFLNLLTQAIFQRQMLVVYFLEITFFIVSTFLYSLVLISLYKGWRSKNSLLNVPFFKLCFVTGICDVCKFQPSKMDPNITSAFTVILVNNNLGNVLPKTCAFSEFYQSLGKPFLHAYFLIAWGGGLCQGLCVVVIAFNRFTTIVYPELNLKVG